jgi:hypothetical protein
LKNCSNEIRSNEIRIRREPSVIENTKFNVVILCDILNKYR